MAGFVAQTRGKSRAPTVASALDPLRASKFTAAPTAARIALVGVQVVVA
jgi:hypothetical protein